MPVASARVPQSAFKDHFSRVAAQYASFRPRYPAELFDYLAGLAPARSLVWDCACGTGQASIDLAARFDAVIATDASEQQITHAQPHPRIQYRVAPAEKSGIEPDSVDLATVAQAVHWFDHEAFYAEVRRVLRPGGVLAVWGYGSGHLDDPAPDGVFTEFLSQTVGPFWPPERHLVEEGYRSLPFPFPAIEPPDFGMFQDWTLEQLLGYARSWSATARYIDRHGVDPVAGFAARLAPLWGDPQRRRRLTWPLAIRIGRKP